MKALQMLDYVMLWVARVYIVFLTIVACNDICFCLSATFVGATLDDPLPTIVAKAVAQSVFLIASFLLIHKYIARFCLGVAAALLFTKGAFAASHRLGELPYIIPGHMLHFLAITFLINGIPLLGLVSMIWISICPPLSSKGSPGNFLSHHTLPQSC